MKCHYCSKETALVVATIPVCVSCDIERENALKAEKQKSKTSTREDALPEKRIAES